MGDQLDTPADPAVTTRRRILRLIASTLSALGSLTLAVPLVGSFVGPALRRKRRHFAKAAELASLPVPGPVSLTFADRTEDAYLKSATLRTVWALQPRPGDVVVYSPICPHLGCMYTWDAQRRHFECPCHGSVFGLDGRVLAGPAPRPLDTLPTKLDRGGLLVEWQRFKLGVPGKVLV